MQASPPRASSSQLFLPVIIDSEYPLGGRERGDAGDQYLIAALVDVRRTIAIRRRYKAFSKGTIEFLFPDNGKPACLCARI